MHEDGISRCMQTRIRTGWWSGAVAAVFAAWGLCSAPAATITGAAREVSSNVVHPNGNIYDQVLLTGVTATVAADAGQVMRLSFIDLNDDIVQVEFSGRGSLTITLENPTGPAVAKKYNQPDVVYMKGHATIEIEGSDASTKIGVFSVGTKTAFNPALFQSSEVYDGIADLALLYIKADPANPNGSNFGGIWMGNVQFWRGHDRTGIYAPRVHVQESVIFGDISAYDDATPVLWFGVNSQFASANLTGGNLAQPNGRLIQASYALGISVRAGQTSHGVELPVQAPRGQLVLEDGTVVTIPPPSGPIWL